MESKVCSHFIPRLDLHVCWKYRVYLFSYRIKVGAYISALIYQIVYFLYNYLYTLFSSISVSFNNKRNFIRWWVFCFVFCFLPKDLYFALLKDSHAQGFSSTWIFVTRDFSVVPLFYGTVHTCIFQIIYVMTQQNIIIPF